MVVHAYSPSNGKVEGRFLGILASKVPMVLCSIWETRLLCSARRNRMTHNKANQTLCPPTVQSLEANVSFLALSSLCGTV